MPDSKYYICEYCFTEYIPKRRRVQKFCKDSCRSSFHRFNKQQKKKDNLPNIKEEKLEVPHLHSTPKMSLAGVGNAAVGTLAADALKSILTKESNKPATKGDISQLFDKLNLRFHPVKNIPPNHLGEHAYYDIVTGNCVYLPK